MHVHTNIKYHLKIHNPAIIGICESKVFYSILIDNKQLKIGILARYNGSRQITYVYLYVCVKYILAYSFIH